MNSKKAVTTLEIIMWIPRLIFLVVIMIAIIILIKSFVTKTVDVSELEANIFIHRILYAPTGLSYFDPEIKRAYPGIIEIDKFKSQINEKFLETSVYYGEENTEIGSKFLLKDLSENAETTVFYNEDFFKDQKMLVDAGYTQGPGGARGYTKKYNVLILKNNVLHKGLLTIEVIIPNS